MRKRRSKIEIVGNIIHDNITNQWGIRLVVGGVFKWFVAGDDEFYRHQLIEPQRFHELDHSSLWVFRDKVIKHTPDESTIAMSVADLMLLVKHSVLQSEAAMSRIRREVQAFENLQQVVRAQRERIPEKIRLFVWQRDEGQCVRCGSRARLEYDHIIPVVEGGSSTERNIQLLCETCNRQKGRSI